MTENRKGKWQKAALVIPGALVVIMVAVLAISGESRFSFLKDSPQDMDSRASQKQASQKPGTSLVFEQRLLAIINARGQEHLFRVEIADTPATRALGLMFRRSLAFDAGMFLSYPRPQPVSIWMKNTYLSLDLLYINAQDRIVQIVAGTTPLSRTPIPSRQHVTAVLELPAGSIKRFALAVGDQIVWRD